MSKTRKIATFSHMRLSLLLPIFVLFSVWSTPLSAQDAQVIILAENWCCIPQGILHRGKLISEEVAERKSAKQIRRFKRKRKALRQEGVRKARLRRLTGKIIDIRFVQTQLAPCAAGLLFP